MSSQTEYSVAARRAALRRVRKALEARIAERLQDDQMPTGLPVAGNREFSMDLPDNDRKQPDARANHNGRGESGV